MPLSKEELEKQLETQKKARQERELRLADIHLRDAANGEEVDDNYNIVDGKPVCIGEKTKLFEIDGIEYFEVMEPGCFDEADLSDVVFNVNHGDGNHAVARTRNKTLELEVKEDGVYYNLECIEQNKYHRLKRNIAISKIIHDKEIEKIQGYLLNCKCDTYDLTQDNCCHFAIGFFNAVIDELNLTMYTAPVMLFNHLLVAKLPKGFKKYRRIKLPKDMLSRRFKFDTGVINEDILNDLCDNQDSDNHILELGDEK